MPYKKPKKHEKPKEYKTPYEKIESIFGVGKFEVGFTKQKGPYKELIDISILRTDKNVGIPNTRIKDKFYHTHIIKRLANKFIENKFVILPSSIDVVNLIHLKIIHNESRSAIFIIDPNSKKEVGRTFFEISNKAEQYINKLYNKNKEKNLNSIQNKLIKDLLKDINFPTKLKETIFSFLDKNKSSIALNHLISKISKDYSDKVKLNVEIGRKQAFLKDKIEQELGILNNSMSLTPQSYLDLFVKLGIKFRFVPMPGYKLNKKTMIFEK